MPADPDRRRLLVASAPPAASAPILQRHLRDPRIASARAFAGFAQGARARLSSSGRPRRLVFVVSSPQELGRSSQFELVVAVELPDNRPEIDVVRQLELLQA